MELIIRSNTDSKITIEDSGKVIIESLKHVASKEAKPILKKTAKKAVKVTPKIKKEVKASRRGKGRPVEFVYSGTERKRFNTLTDAGLYFGVKPSAIWHAINRNGEFRKIKCYFIDEKEKQN